MESGTSDTHLEDRVRTLEKSSANTGLSFLNICELLDGLRAAKNDAVFHCCVNNDNNKMDCQTKTLAEERGIQFLGDDGDGVDDGRDLCDLTKTADSCLPD